VGSGGSSWDTIGDLMGAYIDSTYRVAYSWYDPVTNIESPMGPYIETEIIDSINAAADSSFFNLFTLGYLNPHQCPTRWIRVYRTTMKDGQVGKTTQDVWYGVLQVKIENNLVAIGDDDTATVIKLGFMSDDSLVSTSDYEALGIDTTAGYNQENMVIDEDGSGILIRPPFKEALTIPFSDMEEANGRLWGIGDPLYKQRLYYSDWGAIDGWSALNYLSLGESENDELVALERSHSTAGDVLFAFKHNSIYAITGYDLDYDLRYSKLFSDLDIGVVSRRTITKAYGGIYFLSPNMRIYRIVGAQLEEISQPIENYIDSFFVDYKTADTGAICYVMTDKVMWRNGSNTLAYNIGTNSWSVEEIAQYDAVGQPLSAVIFPQGSFRYDTLHNVNGFGENSYVHYQAQAYVDSTTTLYTEWGGLYDSLKYDAGETLGVFDLEYQTPFVVGDGNYLWMVRKLEMTMTGDSGVYIYYSIWNQDNDSLVADSIMLDNRASSDYIVGVPNHSGKYLSVKIEDRDSDTLNLGNFKLRDIQVYPMRLGRLRVE
jgi:hypothetical protein